MPLIRINATGPGPRLHDDAARPAAHLHTAMRQCKGPVVVMVHGLGFAPGGGRHCPHRHILSQTPAVTGWRVRSWPRALRLAGGGAAAGIGIAFGWHGRGRLRGAYARAGAAGDALAELVATIRAIDPERPVHAIAHSLGARVVLASLPAQRGARGIDRAILMTGAEYASTAAAALDSPAGRRAEIVNVTSRENDLFDFLMERLIPPPCPGDTTIAHALPGGPRRLTVQIDAPAALRALAAQGFRLAPPARRVCHWSAYLRPGVFGLYRALLGPDPLPLARLQAALPAAPDPRWSRLLAPPGRVLPLPVARKTSS